MKKMFAAVASFFRRLKTAWIASRNIDLLDAIEHYKILAKEKQEHVEFLVSLHRDMPDLAKKLYPITKKSEQGVLRVEFKSKRLLTSAEADEVLAQSKVKYQIPDTFSKAARKRLAKYEDKLRNKRNF